MNNSLSINRLGNLFRKHTAEHYKSYLMSLIVLIGVLTIWISFVNLLRREPMPVDMQFDTFMFLFLFAGTLFTSTVFSDLDDQKNAIASLTLPASTFEKYFVKWFYSYIIFQVLFVGVFFMVMQPLQNLFQLRLHDKTNVNLLYEQSLGNVFLAYTILHAIGMWGAIFFKKLHFIKTAFVSLIAFVVFVITNRQIMEATLGIKVFNAIPFTQVVFEENKKYIHIELQDDTSHNLLIMLVLVIAIIFWAAAYFRLKEKQV